MQQSRQKKKKKTTERTRTEKGKFSSSAPSSSVCMSNSKRIKRLLRLLFLLLSPFQLLLLLLHFEHIGRTRKLDIKAGSLSSKNLEAVVEDELPTVLIFCNGSERVPCHADMSTTA